jgi:hypothetical protein
MHITLTRHLQPNGHRNGYSFHRQVTHRKCELTTYLTTIRGTLQQFTFTMTEHDSSPGRSEREESADDSITQNKFQRIVRHYADQLIASNAKDTVRIGDVILRPIGSKTHRQLDAYGESIELPVDHDPIGTEFFDFLGHLNDYEMDLQTFEDETLTFHVTGVNVVTASRIVNGLVLTMSIRSADVDLLELEIERDAQEMS